MPLSKARMRERKRADRSNLVKPKGIPSGDDNVKPAQPYIFESHKPVQPKPIKLCEGGRAVGRAESYKVQQDYIKGVQPSDVTITVVDLPVEGEMPSYLVEPMSGIVVQPRQYKPYSKATQTKRT